MVLAVLIYRCEIVDRHADCDAQTTGAFLNPAFTSYVLDWHAIECLEDQVRASPVKNREDRMPVGARNSPDFLKPQTAVESPGLLDIGSRMPTLRDSIMLLALFARYVAA